MADRNLMKVETIKRQITAPYECLVTGQSLWVRALSAAYTQYVRDTKAAPQLRYASFVTVICLCSSFP